MEGYAHLAWRMTTNADLAIVRRFTTLNTQNLLYLQAELTVLEKTLREIERENCASEIGERKVYSRDWEKLRNANASEGGDDKQWRMFLLVREKLSEYSTYHTRRMLLVYKALRDLDKALTQQAIISQLQRPSSNGLDVLRRILEDPDKPDYLLGEEYNTWNDERFRRDLIALNRPYDHDYLTLLFMKAFLATFHKLFGRYLKDTPHADPSVPNYNDEHLERPAAIISIALSSLLPVASIVVLHSVHNQGKRLAIIAIFTACFSVLLALLTKASRSEIFAATAAYVAVQVVFISTNT